MTMATINQVVFEGLDGYKEVCIRSHQGLKVQLIECQPGSFDSSGMPLWRIEWLNTNGQMMHATEYGRENAIAHYKRQRDHLARLKKERQAQLNLSRKLVSRSVNRRDIILKLQEFQDSLEMHGYTEDDKLEIAEIIKLVRALG